MFPNILFNLFSSQPLQKKFNVQRQSFSSGSDYYVVKDSSVNGQTLKSNGRTFIVTDSHLTVPELQDKKEGFFSAYHHSLYLVEKDTNKNHVLHIYFDRFDNYCENPRPVIKTLEDNKDTRNNLELNHRDIEQVLSRFVYSSLEKIKVVRAAQKNILNALYKVKENCEIQTSNKINTYGFGSQEHIDSLQKLVKVLSDIELYELPHIRKDKATGFIQPRNDIYLKLQRELLNEIISAKATPSLAEVDEERENNGEYSKPIVEASATKKLQELNEQVNQRKQMEMDKQKKAYQEFFETFNLTFNVFKSKKSNNNLFDVIELHAKVNSYLETKDIDHKDLMVLQVNVIDEIKDYISNLNQDFDSKITALTKYPFMYDLIDTKALDVAAFLLIKKGDHKKLTKLLNTVDFPILDPVTDPDTAAQKHALLEWCVVLNQPTCFAQLVKIGHEPGLFNSPDSPVNNMIGDFVKGAPFMDAILKNGLYSKLARNNTEVLSVARQRLELQKNSGEFNPETLKINEVRLSVSEKVASIEVRIRELIRNSRSPIILENLIGKSTNILADSFNKILKSNPDFKEVILNDLEILQLIDEQYELSLQFLSKIDGNILINYYKSMNSVNTQSVDDTEITKYTLIQGLKYSNDNQKLLIRYFELGKTVLNPDGKLFFKDSKDTKKAAAFNKEKKELEDRYNPTLDFKSLMQGLEQLKESLASIGQLADECGALGSCLEKKKKM